VKQHAEAIQVFDLSNRKEISK